MPYRVIVEVDDRVVNWPVTQMIWTFEDYLEAVEQKMELVEKGWDAEIKEVE